MKIRRTTDQGGRENPNAGQNGPRTGWKEHGERRRAKGIGPGGRGPRWAGWNMWRARCPGGCVWGSALVHSPTKTEMAGLIVAGVKIGNRERTLSATKRSWVKRRPGPALP